jgi:hypothetical protein
MGEGTISQLAEMFGVKLKTLYWLASPTGQKRDVKHRGWNVVVMDEEDDYD